MKEKHTGSAFLCA